MLRKKKMLLALVSVFCSTLLLFNGIGAQATESFTNYTPVVCSDEEMITSEIEEVYYFLESEEESFAIKFPIYFDYYVSSDIEGTSEVQSEETFSYDTFVIYNDEEMITFGFGTTFYFPEYGEDSFVIEIPFYFDYCIYVDYVDMECIESIEASRAARNIVATLMIYVHRWQTDALRVFDVEYSITSTIAMQVLRGEIVIHTSANLLDREEIFRNIV